MVSDPHPIGRWQVVLVAPPGYAHWRVFEEPAVVVRGALLDCGYDCTLAVNELDSGRTNLVLGYHLRDDPGALCGTTTVLYQMEAMGVGAAFDTLRSRELLRHATAVWELSSRNAECLRGEGIPATVIPLGYHTAAELIPSAPPDVDVLFSGSITPRRAAIVARIRDGGTDVRMLFGAYGPTKQALLARARIHLYVHALEAPLFPQPRIAHLLANGCFVLAERVGENPYPLVDLVQIETAELPEACRYYLAHPALRQEIADRTYQQFRRHYPMSRLVEPGITAVRQRLGAP